jgi:hypothetical protein
MISERRLSAHITIWEWATTAAFVGIGALGLLEPAALERSVFFPVMRSFISAAMMGVFVLCIGLCRMIVCLVDTTALQTRMILAGISGLIWAQYAVGFVSAIPSQGLRPGMVHVASMVLGEVVLLYWLARARNISGPEEVELDSENAGGLL